MSKSMSLHRVVALPAAVALALLTVPATAQPPSGQVFGGRAVVNAPAGGSSIDVTITKAMRLSPSLALPPDALQVTGSAGMTLVVLRAKKTSSVAGALPAQLAIGKTPAAAGGDVFVAPTGANSDTGKEVFFGEQRLAPGQYRLYVVATAPVQVRLSLPGATGPVLRLANRSRHWSKTVDLPPPSVGGTAAPTAAVGSTQSLDDVGLVFTFLVIDSTAELGHYLLGGCLYRGGGPPAGRWLPGCPGGLVGFVQQVGRISASGSKKVAFGVVAHLPPDTWGAGLYYDYIGTTRSVDGYQAWLTY